jgi:hypothetical protein
MSSGNVSQIGFVLGDVSSGVIRDSGFGTSFHNSILSIGQVCRVVVSTVSLWSRKSHIRRFSFVALAGATALVSLVVRSKPGGLPGLIILCSPGGGSST